MTAAKKGEHQTQRDVKSELRTEKSEEDEAEVKDQNLDPRRDNSQTGDTAKFWKCFIFNIFS